MLLINVLNSDWVQRANNYFLLQLQQQHKHNHDNRNSRHAVTKFTKILSQSFSNILVYIIQYKTYLKK